VALDWFGDTVKSRKINSNEIVENIDWQGLDRKSSDGNKDVTIER
jgi:hypothetical protein